MKGIATLIRLAKRELDELKRKQVALETQKDQLLKAIAKLHSDLQNEMKVAAKTQEMASFYGGFAKRMKAREDDIRAEIKKIEEELLQLAEQIMLAFTDLKKYEIAQENDKQRKRAEENRKETIMLDDIASNQFIRKQVTE